MKHILTILAKEFNLKSNTMNTDNKIIAEFMGVVFHDDDNQYYSAQGLYIGTNLQYHTSWDWLMPVIEEIDHTSYEPIESIEDGIATRSLEMTHKAVVEYIKTYER